MKKVLSGILALMITVTLTIPALASGGIIAEEVKINSGEENFKDCLKDDLGDEEGMLRISPSMLLKIKLKLEGSDVNGQNISFLANQLVEDGSVLTGDQIQFIDEKSISADGTVSIQFRPRENQPDGIYNMRSKAKGSPLFSKFYKTVSEQIQPKLSRPNDTAKKKDIKLTISDYTDEWGKVSKLYEIKDNVQEEIPTEDYSIQKDSANTKIATVNIKTTGEWATEGPHTFRFVSEDIAYNPMTFTVNITEPEKISSKITSDFVSTGNVSEGLRVTTTLPQTALEGNTIEFTVTPPKGYSITGVAYKKENGENINITESEGKYSFVMPDKAVNVTVIIAPIEYTINFDIQGGTGESNSIKGTIENLPILPDDPEKQYHSFVGWFVPTENGGRRRITQEIINNSFNTMLDLFDEEHQITLTANYTENGRYEVVYQAPYAENKPTGGNYDAKLNPIITISDQEPVRKGYTFIGWKIQGDVSEVIYKKDGDNRTYTVPENVSVVTFIAQWEENQTDEYEIASVNQENGKIDIIKRTDESAWLIVATYTDSDSLVRATIKDISNIKTTAAGEVVEMPYAFDGDYAKVKVFIWNSLSDMQPRCPAFPINK